MRKSTTHSEKYRCSYGHLTGWDTWPELASAKCAPAARLARAVQDGRSVQLINVQMLKNSLNWLARTMCDERKMAKNLFAPLRRPCAAVVALSRGKQHLERFLCLTEDNRYIGCKVQITGPQNRVWLVGGGILRVMQNEEISLFTDCTEAVHCRVSDVYAQYAAVFRRETGLSLAACQELAAAYKKRFSLECCVSCILYDELV